MATIKIPVYDEDYTNKLIVALVRQGYKVYYWKDEKEIRFEIEDCDIIGDI